MRIHSSFLALLLLLPGLAAAAPLEVADEQGTPAIIGKGSSSTTVSVIGGAAKVTVAASGNAAVHTKSGKVEGEGAMALPEFGIELGGGASNAAPEDASGPDSEVPGAAAIDPASGATDPSCRDLDLRGIGADELAAVADPDLVDILSADGTCDASGTLSADMTAIVEQNTTLVDALEAGHHRPGDLVAIGTRGDGRVVLLVSAD